MTRFERIHNILTQAFSPVTLILEDESNKHRRPGVETHFKVILVSNQFKTIKRIDRHRQVQTLLQDELKTGLHALSLHLYTEEEWQTKQNFPETPDCQKNAKS